MSLFDELSGIGFDVLKNEPMNRHTSFKTGGPAEIFASPRNIDELLRVFEICKVFSAPITILGGGTNVLVLDEGINGVVVSTANINYVRIFDETRIRVGAGAKLLKLAEAALDGGLDGLAFSHGIPGTVGGAICMNAGAYGSEVGDFVESVTVFDLSVKVLAKAEMKFGYRTSIAESGSVTVLEVVFSLKSGCKNEIFELMQEYKQKRKKTQPLEYPSAGSTFKRPPGNFAGALIEKCGLKGYKIGGAQVSEKHAGFIINTGGATSGDILALMQSVQDKVFQESGVRLVPEVKILWG